MEHERLCVSEGWQVDIVKDIKNNKQPEIVVFAGPNGSGKSTFTEFLKPPIAYVNADDIKNALKCSDMEAATEAERQREAHLANNEEFCFETVMSTDRNLKLLQRAREKGYFIRCYYILTADPEINVYRVQSRVAEGGHDVPREKIIKRYERALKLVKDVVAVSHVCHIYDNSEERPFRIFKKRKDTCYYQECEDWLLEDIQLLTGASEMIAFDLNTEK